MNIKIMKSGKAVSVPGGLGAGLLTNILVTLILSGLLAYFIYIKVIAWEMAGYGIIGILLAASFSGAKVAVAMIKAQIMVISIMSGVLYWVVLLCVTALFFGGHYGAFLETAALIMAGSVAAALLRIPRRTKYF